MNEIQEIINTDQYQSLVEDCKAIIVEGIFRSRQELIDAYKELGERIVGDPLYKKHAKVSQGKFIKQLIEDIGKGQRTIYYAIQYVEKLDNKEFATALQSYGKNLSYGIKYSKMVTLPHKSIIGREKLEQKARDILMSIYDNTIKFINEGGIID